jgi:hypothetical protein
MIIIDSFADLEAQWPEPFQDHTGDQVQGQCPFCPPDYSTNYNANGIPFTGHKRFWLRPAAILKGGNCRDCKLAGRGDKGNGWYSFKSICEQLGAQSGTNVKSEAVDYERPREPLSKLWHDFMVDNAHKEVDYGYWWEKCRWPRELVDRFKLGWGDIKTAYIGPAHVIPMKIRNLDSEVAGWYMEARKDGIKPHRTPGSSAGHFWLFETDPDSRTLVIAESAKNNITHVQLGWPNVLSTFGAGNISQDLINWIWTRGYRHLILTGDAGDGGAKFNDNLIRYANNVGKFESIKFIDWPDTYENNYDTTDLHRDLYGKDVRSVIEGWLQDRWEKPINVVIPDIILDLDEIRGEGPTSTKGEIRHFFETYKPGEMLILNVEMGGGKTHALVKEMERLTLDHMQQRNIDKDMLEKQIADYEDQLKVEFDARNREAISKLLNTARQALANFSYTAVAWFGQYRGGWDDLMELVDHPELWFNFEARNEENCDHYQLVQRLATNHHDIGRFCHSACPFAEKCRQSGYLAQDQARRQTGITFFRHPQLVIEAKNEYPVATVVDENPTHLWNVPMTIEDKDLYPHNDPDDFENAAEYTLIALLMGAIRAAMSVNKGAKPKTPEYEIRGGRFLALVDEMLQAKGTTLEQIMADLEDSSIADQVQPNYTGGDRIQKRCIKDVFKAIQETLPLYLENKYISNNVGTVIHCIGGTLQIFTHHDVRTRSRIPLIVADGTAMPETLMTMFRRKAKVVRLGFRNENAITTQITNSDWTKGEWNRQLGNRVSLAKRQLSKIIPESDPNNPIDISELPAGQDLYDSSYLKEATHLIQGLVDLHEKLLVICYKDVRWVLEQQIFLIDPTLEKKIALAHYGSLRGTNQFQDWPAVVLIGAYRVPYDVLYREISMWAFLMGERGIIDDETVVAYEVYDGQATGYEFRSFAHPFAHQYVQQAEKSEIWQSAMRIRPHSTKQRKYIYIAMGRPVGKAINRVVKKKQFLDELRPSKRKAIYQEMLRIGKLTLEEEGKVKMPSYAALAKRFAVSKGIITEIKDRILAEKVFPDWKG